MRAMVEVEVEVEPVRVGPLALTGELALPPDAAGVVLFAHGWGSGGFGARNRRLGAVWSRHRFATLRFDLLTDAEAGDGPDSLDLGLLGARVGLGLRWAALRPDLAGLRIGLFGARSAAAATLLAAAIRPGSVAAVVACGGRPDRAAACLARVSAPTLLIVGGADRQVLEFNRQALRQLSANKRLEVVPGASNRFDEPGALSGVAELAAAWFDSHLAGTLHH